ncbi:MAG: aminotransferase class IV [Anaerolineae bacterium]
MSPYKVSLNGKIVSPDQAQISLYSPAVLYGFGVYESIEVINGTPFYLDKHLKRLFESAGMIEMDLPWSINEITKWAYELLEHLSGDYLLRVIALELSERKEDKLVAILPQLLPHYPAQYYQDGVHLVTYEGCRHMPACKSLNTLVNLLARRHALRAGAHEAVLCSNGKLTEGSRSNIFAVYKGEVLTPPSNQVLPGITRDIVIQLATETGYGVRERNLWLAEVDRYDEFFITSTSMHIIPVVEIDGIRVGNGRVGEVTRELMQRFEIYHHHYLEGLRQSIATKTAVISQDK